MFAQLWPRCPNPGTYPGPRRPLPAPGRPLAGSQRGLEQFFPPIAPHPPSAQRMGASGDRSHAALVSRSLRAASSLTSPRSASHPGRQDTPGSSSCWARRETGGFWESDESVNGIPALVTHLERKSEPYRHSPTAPTGTGNGSVVVWVLAALGSLGWMGAVSPTAVGTWH